MFSLHMTISVPTNLYIAGLRGEFMDFCDHLNLDAIMEPVK
jgi:glycine cleavage system transcriptional repressor